MPLDANNTHERTPPPRAGDGDWLHNLGVSRPEDRGSVSTEAASKQPVPNKILPHMDVPDNSTEAAKESDQHFSKAQPKDWTVAIDLAESEAPDSENPKGAGVDRQLPELKQLAKETEGKSVNFVVHAQRPVDKNLKPCQLGQEGLDKRASCMQLALDHKAITTEDYFIHDGKIEKLPDANYKDAAGDLATLVKEAGMLAPSKNLGLIVDSHGAGSGGIETNLGTLSLDQTVDAIKIGLLSISREKLDLLDYDACDMGAAKVMDQSRQVANDVVASAALEDLTYTNDAQNVAAAMRGLLGNSKMSGRQLGETIVELARTGADGTGDNNAIKTLANFDLTKYDAFIQNLDRFGAAISTTAKDAGNLKQILADIDKTPIPETNKPEPEAHDRDLKAFVQNVLADSQAHKFKGDTTQLVASAKDLIQSFAPLITAQFGSPQRGYDHLGGLTTPLPGNEIMDSTRVAREVTPLHELSNELRLVLDTTPHLSYKPRVSQYIDHKVGELPPALTRQYPKQIHELKTAQAAVEMSQDLTAYRAALIGMQEVTSKIDSGPMGSMAAKGMTRKAADEQLSYFNAPLEQVAPNWDNFVELMQEQQK